MALELSQETSSSLAALSQAKTFNPAQLTAVVKLTADCLIRAEEVSAAFDGAQSLSGLDRRLLKSVHAGVATLLLEAAKQDYDEELFQSLLSQQGFGPKQSDIIKEVYMSHKAALRDLLRKSTFHFPHVVDVDWRLDYHLRSSGVEKVDEPLWYITLKTVTDQGEMKDVLFTCNREGMQELLAKVKDAESAARLFSE